MRVEKVMTIITAAGKTSEETWKRLQAGTSQHEDVDKISYMYLFLRSISSNEWYNSDSTLPLEVVTLVCNLWREWVVLLGNTLTN